MTDQTSILKFIEDNWQFGRIGDQSFDARAGSLANLFDFGHGDRSRRLFLDPTSGAPDRPRPPGLGAKPGATGRLESGALTRTRGPGAGLWNTPALAAPYPPFRSTQSIAHPGLPQPPPEPGRRERD